jgi:hypothetical protein
MHSLRPLVLALLLSASTAFSQAKPETPIYTRLNTFGVFGEYSSNSSHIFLGVSQNRKLLNFGVSYSRRLILNHVIDGQYMIELTPIIFESDPLYTATFTHVSPPPAQTDRTTDTFYAACHPFSETFSSVDQGVTYTNTIAVTCNQRQWTFGQGFSPIGFKLNFLPRHPIQPFLTFLGGYMFATRPIPVSDASSANFTFSVGAGFEFYRSATRSIRAEYRLHHLSNAGIADDNPGIDSQIIQLTYAFGR